MRLLNDNDDNHENDVDNENNDDNDNNNGGLAPTATTFLTSLFAGRSPRRSVGPHLRVVTAEPAGRGPQDDNHGNGSAGY